MANTKRPLELDWDKLLPSQDSDEPPPPAVIVTTTSEPKKQKLATAKSGSDTHHNEELQKLSDIELDGLLLRQNETFQKMRFVLADKGDKIRVAIDRLEKEKERRKLRRVEQEIYECEKPIEADADAKAESSCLNGASVSIKQHDDSSSEAQTHSLFSSQFSKRLEDQTECRTEKAFSKELSYLKQGDSHKMKQNGCPSPKRSLRSQKPPFQSPRGMSVDKGCHVLSNDNQNTKDSSTCYLPECGESLSSCLLKKRNASVIPCSHDARLIEEQPVVIVDEEENLTTNTPREAEKIAESLKENTLYYPSRDDPESVEISNSDMECLAPETFLTSPIMNFYIRYLQQLATMVDRERREYHFFNTYFYKKLKEALSYKGSDKETYFMKFRRWWKGVSIFQKAYVFIPIHEFLHWSLVIICIPDKEDESGPIILHLDSLRLHNSRTIFSNIRSYIKEEWNHLKQEVSPSDVPIAEKIWNNIPRRVDVKSIEVPQQKNDYDCGLFVLYFMERFIEEAPDRLKKKDLAMFGKQWFQAEEASGLRGKIWNKLMQEFMQSEN